MTLISCCSSRVLKLLIINFIDPNRFISVEGMNIFNNILTKYNHRKRPFAINNLQEHQRGPFS